MSIISASHLSKTYAQGRITVFKNIHLSIQKGKSVALVGDSGRGKTTLLYLLSGLDYADQGSIIINETSIIDLNEEKLALFRAKYFGFVFQHHFLLNDLDAFENTLLPLRILNQLTPPQIQKIHDLFDYFGLANRKKHFPNELSGGEKQRVALIRALANNPLIIFADEPTGSLDKDNAKKLEDLLINFVKQQNSTLVLSTHNQEFAKKCDHIYSIDELEGDN